MLELISISLLLQNSNSTMIYSIFYTMIWFWSIFYSYIQQNEDIRNIQVATLLRGMKATHCDIVIDWLAKSHATRLDFVTQWRLFNTIWQCHNMLLPCLAIELQLEYFGYLHSADYSYRIYIGIGLSYKKCYKPLLSLNFVVIAIYWSVPALHNEPFKRHMLLCGSLHKCPAKFSTPCLFTLFVT